MKKQNVLAALVSSVILFSFTANAASDRCSGKISSSLLQSEAVSVFYFDMKIHELICTYVLKGAELEAIEADVLAARTQIKPTLIKAQDHMVARMGGEGPFESYFAAVGNHMSYLNLKDPCGRARDLANAMVASKATSKSKIVKVYQPFSDSLRAQYKAKASQEFTRICDRM